jgi:hypothetical protein
MSNIEITSSVASADANVAPASGQANGALAGTETVGFEQFLSQFRKYESVLDLMIKSTSDDKFKQEVATIEQWFRVLTEPEKNSSVHSLLKHCSQDQLRFLQSIITSMIKPEEIKVTPVGQERMRLGKLTFRPPSLNLPDITLPVTPTPITAKESAVDEQSQLEQALRQAPGAAPAEPSVPAKDPNSTNPLPGFSGINPYTLNMLANAGLSKDAQLLAAQLVMSGIVQPTGLLQQQPSAKLKKGPLPTGNWRTPSSARFPASALKSSGLRQSSSLKSAGLRSSGLAAPQTPLSAILDSPQLEEFNPELLNDIPAWLRSLRLHKYAPCFDGLTWQEIVLLDDATLEAKGVAALGARRRLSRSFEQVRKEMGMEEPNSATPTTSTIPVPQPAAEQPTAPHSAFPRSKLSINSPIFTPTWEANKTPQSAVPLVDLKKEPAVDAVTQEPSINSPILTPTLEANKTLQSAVPAEAPAVDSKEESAVDAVTQEPSPILAPNLEANKTPQSAVPAEAPAVDSVDSKESAVDAVTQVPSPILAPTLEVNKTPQSAVPAEAPVVDSNEPAVDAVTQEGAEAAAA